jgi:septal ring factor EnvC (AmiA/AmiB activator)
VRELNKNVDLQLLPAAAKDRDAERRHLREERKQLEEDVAAFEAEKRGKSAHEAETEEHVRRIEAEIVRLQTREKVPSLLTCVWKFMFSRVTVLQIKSNQQIFYCFF